MGFVALAYLISFFMFDRLVRLEYQRQRSDWIADGMPHGIFWVPAETVKLGGLLISGASSLASLRCWITWMFSTPHPSAYEQLSEKSQAESSVQELGDSLRQMHPRSWPHALTATEFEPLPGQQALKVFLGGKVVKEDFYYVLMMEGTADTGYKVSRISRLNAPFPSSSTKKSLPIQRTTH